MDSSGGQGTESVELHSAISGTDPAEIAVPSDGGSTPLDVFHLEDNREVAFSHATVLPFRPVTPWEPTVVPNGLFNLEQEIEKVMDGDEDNLEALEAASASLDRQLAIIQSGAAASQPAPIPSSASFQSPMAETSAPVVPSAQRPAD